MFAFEQEKSFNWEKIQTEAFSIIDRKIKKKKIRRFIFSIL
jgi:hypothetical protein